MWISSGTAELYFITNIKKHITVKMANYAASMRFSCVKSDDDNLLILWLLKSLSYKI